MQSKGGVGMIIAFIIGLIVVIIGINLIDPLANAVVDVSGLAILGSFGGASALLDLLVIIAVAAVIIAAVEILFRVTTGTGVVQRIRRRR